MIWYLVVQCVVVGWIGYVGEVLFYVFEQKWYVGEWVGQWVVGVFVGDFFYWQVDCCQCGVYLCCVGQCGFQYFVCVYFVVGD